MPQVSSKFLRNIDRRSFIGGSDARIIMCDDEAALIQLWREKRGDAEPEDLSGNLIVQLGAATEELKSLLVREEYRPACHGCPTPREAFRHSLDGGDPGRHRGGNRRRVRSQIHAALVILRGGGRRKIHGPGPAQHVGHALEDLGVVDHHRWRQVGRDHDPHGSPLPECLGIG